jgi:hypothetical protein
MSTIQTKESRQVPPPTELLEKQFRLLADQWVSETGMQSSMSIKLSHPAYLAIIDMGQKVLPLILRELRDRPNHWFGALRAIAMESPVPEHNRSDPLIARTAWLDWGKEKGLID